MTAFALHQIGDPRAPAALAEVLDDPLWRVRVEAVGYFGALHKPRFRGRIDWLQNDTPHIAVRLAADEAISKMQWEDANEGSGAYASGSRATRTPSKQGSGAHPWRRNGNRRA